MAIWGQECNAGAKPERSCACGPVAARRGWIARPSAANSKQGTVLPVDWDAITRAGATATNYQLTPGDRVFIAEDRVVAPTNDIAKKTAPIERILGLIALAASTLRSLLPQSGCP
jgi:polysaccharide biosynthesis/export protein